MIDYIINILKGIFKKENEEEPEQKPKKAAKKPKGLNPKKKKARSRKQGNMS